MSNKYRLYFILSSLLVIGLIITLVMNNRKGTFSISGDNSIVRIECPATASNSEEVTCDVFIDISNSTILSVNANYDMPNGLNNDSISFEANETCNSNNCFEKFVSTENGFSVINKSGATTTAKIGSIKFTMNGQSNNQYTIGLKNIELCNSEYEMISLNNVGTTIRVKNNDATITNITLDKEVKNSNFDATNHKYTATIIDNKQASEIVNLNITKSDSNATMTGPITNLNLHYGTNTYNITITSEDGKVTNTYTIEIYREFDFEPGNNGYIYNKNYNYIYIKNDSINTFYNNLKQLPENLTYNVSGNKLEILYANDEVLQSINIIYFVSDYQLIDGEIYVANNITLQNIKNKITSTNATIKYYDNNTEITSNSTIIKNGNTVKIYYNNNELDSYSIKVEYLNFDDSLVIDDSKKIVKRIPLNQTFGGLKSKIDTSGEISLQTNVTVDDNYKLRTGDKLQIELNDSTLTYTLSVVGCLDNEVNVSLGDVIKLYRHLKNRISLTDEYLYAADISNDGSIGLDDVIYIYRYLKGKIPTLEVE